MRSYTLACLLSLFALAAAESQEAIAVIDFCQGPVSVTREGRLLSATGIGDEIQNGDLVATGAAATLSLKLEKSTGMSGAIKLSANTSFYFSLDRIKGESHGQAELITGQLGLKVKKLAGAPRLEVTTESAVCAVRGTEFDVLTSSDGSLLVACAEGEVECSSDGVTTSALPGQAVERLEGSRLSRRAVALEDYEGLKARWIDAAAKAFERNAPRAARLIAARYLELSTRLAANQKSLAASGALRAWLEEERTGVPSALSGDELDRRLAEAGPLLAESRAILATMERMAARVSALEGLVGGDAALMAQSVRRGLTLADFFKRFDAAKESDRQRIFALRKAMRIWKRATAEREALRAGGPTSP